MPAKQTETGTASGNTIPVNPYLREYRHLPEPPEASAANELDISASNIGAVTIDPRQAKVGCDATLNVTTDGPLEVTLLGCGDPRRFG